jgi:hypothetical protein
MRGRSRRPFTKGFPEFYLHFLKDIQMTKSTMSILLASMMALSGFAAAQTVELKAGTQGGAGPTGASGSGDNGASVTTRAAVKAEIEPMKSGTQGGEGASPNANPNTAKNGSGMLTRTTAAERRAMAEERRAARRAQRMSKTDASMGGSSSVSGAIGDTTVMGGGTGSTGRTLGQGQPGVKQGNSSN